MLASMAVALAAGLSIVGPARAEGPFLTKAGGRRVLPGSCDSAAALSAHSVRRAFDLHFGCHHVILPCALDCRGILAQEEEALYRQIPVLRAAIIEEEQVIERETKASQACAFLHGPDLC